MDRRHGQVVGWKEGPPNKIRLSFSAIQPRGNPVMTEAMRKVTKYINEPGVIKTTF